MKGCFDIAREAKNNTSYSEAKNTVSFFSAVVALMLAAAFLFLRTGFDNSGDTSLFSVLTVLAISWFILLLPVSTRRVTNICNIKAEGPYFNNDAFVSLLGLFLVVVAGVVASFNGPSILFLFVILGLIFIGWSIFDYFRQINVPSFIVGLLLTIFYSTWLASLIWGVGYLHPLLFEGVFFDFGHVDSLYHSAIVGMLKTYGVVSTGLDGVPYTAYHFGSHWIFAQLASLLKMRALTFYQLGFPVIFVPLFINAILLLILNVRRYVFSITDFYLWKDWKLWMLFIVLQVGILPARLSGLIGSGMYTRYVSESYTVALTISLLLMASAIYFFLGKNRKSTLLEQYFLSLFVIPLVIGLIVLSKISIGFLMVVLATYLFWRIGLYKNVVFMLGGGIAFLVALVTVFFVLSPHLVVNSSGNSLSINLINSSLIDRCRSMPLLLLPFYPLLYFLFSLAFIGFRLCALKIVSLGDFFAAVRRRELVDVEILLVLCVFGFLPGVFLSISHGSDGYFTDFQDLIALIFLLAYLPKIWPGKNDSRILPRFFTWIILLPFVITVLFNAAARVHRVLESNVNYRLAIVGKDIGLSSFNDLMKNLVKSKDPRKVVELIKPLYSAGAIKKGMSENKRFHAMQASIQLSSLPWTEKKKSLVYNVDASWYSLERRKHVPFIVPALTEIAVLDGLPPFGDKLVNYYYGGYCYEYYHLRQGPQSIADIKLLCSKARSMGFSQLILLNSETGSVKKIKCETVL